MKKRRGEGTSFPIYSTCVLPTFLDRVKGEGKPAVLDIGPVSGENIEFLLGQGMKVYVEDILAGWEEWKGQSLGEDRMPEHMEAYLQTQLVYPPKFFDGILCWDTLDAMNPLSARLLICRLHEILKHEGTVLTLFGPGVPLSQQQAKYVIADEAHLVYGWAPTKRSYDDRYENRQILEIFSGFTLIRAFQLQNQMREMLFRKVSLSAPQPTPTRHMLQRAGIPQWKSGEGRDRQ